MKVALILSAVVAAVMGQDRCASTITYDKKHTFILASLTEEEINNRLPEAIYKMAAEACYKDCNSAEIMSFSTSYWKHRSPMTILDRAAKFLIKTDFIQINETYFVNHVAIENEEPVGFGCFALETPSEFSLYSLDDPVCSSTRSVLCGMPGIGSTVDGQRIADAIHNYGTPDPNNSSGTVNPDDDKDNHKVIHLPSGINLAEIITNVTANDTLLTDHRLTSADAEVKPMVVEEKNDISFFGNDGLEEEHFYIDSDNLHYRVAQLTKNQNSVSSASLLCDSHDREKMGSLYSSSIPRFAKWFQQTYPSTKIIIETWNGDNYGAKDTQCLTFSSSQGVHLSECGEASTVLCTG